MSHRSQRRSHSHQFHSSVDRRSPFTVRRQSRAFTVNIDSSHVKKFDVLSVSNVKVGFTCNIVHHDFCGNSCLIADFGVSYDQKA
jgi:hypothetical protein